jgi:hypothetical protein
LSLGVFETEDEALEAENAFKIKHGIKLERFPVLAKARNLVGDDIINLLWENGLTVTKRRLKSGILDAE